MYVYLICVGEQNMTHRTVILLCLQQREFLLRVCLPRHCSLCSFLPVGLKCWVVGTAAPADLYEPRDWRGIGFDQFNLAFVERPPAIVSEVAALYPTTAFVGVTAFGPSPEHLPLVMANIGERAASHTVAVVIHPPPDDWVKVTNYLAGSCLLMVAQISLDALQMLQHLFLLRFGQQLVSLSSDGKAEEVIALTYVYDAGFRSTQGQTPAA